MGAPKERRRCDHDRPHVTAGINPHTPGAAEGGGGMGELEEDLAQRIAKGARCRSRHGMRLQRHRAASFQVARALLCEAATERSRGFGDMVKKWHYRHWTVWRARRVRYVEEGRSWRFPALYSIAGRQGLRGRRQLLQVRATLGCGTKGARQNVGNQEHFAPERGPGCR